MLRRRDHKAGTVSIDNSLMQARSMNRDGLASEMWDYAPLREQRGNLRRRDRMLSFWGTVLSLCIPPILIIGVLRNPTGIEERALISLLAVLLLTGGTLGFDWTNARASLTNEALMDSMKDIAGAMLNSRVPVVVWVAPRGATATSAG